MNRSIRIFIFLLSACSQGHKDSKPAEQLGVNGGGGDQSQSSSGNAEGTAFIQTQTVEVIEYTFTDGKFVQQKTQNESVGIQRPPPDQGPYFTSTDPNFVLKLTLPDDKAGSIVYLDDSLHLKNKVDDTSVAAGCYGFFADKKNSIMAISFDPDAIDTMIKPLLPQIDLLASGNLCIDDARGLYQVSNHSELAPSESNASFMNPLKVSSP